MIGTLGLVLVLTHDGEDEKTAAIEPILETALVERDATLAAWERFCGKVGVKPEAVAPTLGPSDGHFWSLVEDTIHAAGISPELDETRVKECLARLTEVWSERTAT